MRGYQTYVDSQTVQKTKVIKSKGATYKVKEGASDSVLIIRHQRSAAQDQLIFRLCYIIRCLPGVFH